jgi:iron complex outermembrane recepter protein
VVVVKDLLFVFSLVPGRRWQANDDTTAAVAWFNTVTFCALFFGSADPASAATHKHAVPLEEIVITGERQDVSRSEVIQAGTFRGAEQLDTPLTVSVITDAVIRSQQDQSLGEVLRNSGGVTALLVSPSVFTNASIRGIPVDGRTNVKLNGSLSLVNFIDLPLETKSRIEVLKGVSALYYGFATPSGIINMVTRGPPLAPELSLSISANQYGQMQPLVEAGTTLGIIGFRGTVAADSVNSGIRHTEGDRQLQSAVISVEPSKTIRLDLNFEHIVKNVTEPTILQGPQKRSLLLSELPRLPDPHDNPGSRGFVNRAHEVNLLARLRWIVTQRWTLTAEGGFSNAKRDRRFSILREFDPHTGFGTLTAQAANDQLYRNSIIRADITGQFETGPISHDLVFGASKQGSHQYFPTPRLVADPTNPDGCIALGLGPSCVQSAFNPIVLRDVNFDGEVPYNPARDTKNVDTGLYAFDRLGVGGPSHDSLQLILGLRKSYYREFIAHARDVWGRTFAADPSTVSAAAVYRPTLNASLYASYIEGLESEPPAPNLTVNQGEILPPARSKQKEFGAKATLKRLLLFNIAYFDIDRRLTYVNSFNRFVNDGVGHYRGLEAGLEGNATRDLSIIASAILLDARESVPGDPIINGKRVEDSARWQWSLYGAYKLAKVLPGFALNGGIFFTGRRPINPENSLFVPGYTTVDVGGAYGMHLAKVPVIARINVSNIFSKRYVSATGSNVLAMGIPMTIRISLTANTR